MLSTDYPNPWQASAPVAEQLIPWATRIATLAMRLCHVAAACVTQSDAGTIQIVSSVANDTLAQITPERIGAWNQVLGNGEIAVIADTAAVPTLAADANMLALPAIRFVARRTLHRNGGTPHTALWLWHHTPHHLNDDTLAALDDLAVLVSAVIAPAPAPSTDTEDTARSTVKRLHALLRNATDLVSINDSQGVVQYISPSVTRILGYHPDDLIGQSSFNFVHPDDFAAISQGFNAVTHGTGVNPSVRMRFRSKNGAWRVLEAVSTNLLDDPHIRGVLINANDITERAQAEAAHKASEARFQAIFSSAPVGIIAADRAGMLVLVNSTLAALFGYEPDELIGQPITRLLPDELPIGVHLQLVGRHRNGTAMPVEVSLRMIEHAGEALLIAFVTDIRERQRMERALRESEDRYRQLIELAPDAVLVIRDGTIQFMNHAGYTALAATSPEAVIGHAIDEFMVRSELPLAKQRMEARMNGEMVDPTCYQVVALDGEIREMEVTSATIAYAGEPALLIVARDVTERNRHDQLMRFQASVLAQLSEAVVAIDTHRRVTYINAAAERYYGHSLNDIRGSMLADLYNVEYLDEGDEVAARQAIQTSNLWHGETCHITTDGRRLIVDTAVVMLRDDDGTPVGMFGVSRDITARKQIEERLELLESVVIHTNDAIMITSAMTIDSPGPQIMYVNSAFTRMTGYTPEDVIGQTPRMLQGANTNPTTLAKIRRALEQQAPIRVEVLNYDKAGQELWLDLSIAPVHDRAGMATHYIAIQRDITQRRQMEAQLLQSQKLESIGRLTGGIAHDFNNLLTGISGYADLALAQAEPASPLHYDLAELRYGIDRAIELTRQLLLFARRQPVQQQQLQLNTVVSGLEKLLRRLIGANITLQITLGADVPDVLIDRSQLEQVLVNLVINARDAMPQGGVITIRTSVLATGSASAAGNPTVRLMVADTGCGMTPEVQAHVFEPFFTTKAVGQGTGLGLSTVYGVIQQHGGTIRIASQQNEGTAMIIDLPAVASSSDNRTPEAANVGIQPAAEAVLVVDDEPAIRDLAARILRSGGYTVYTAPHGKAAIELLQTPAAATICFVVTDVVMPEMDGRQLGMWLGAERPDVGVLYISGNPGLHQQPDAAPLAPLLPKPFTPQALLAAVRAGIQRLRPA